MRLRLNLCVCVCVCVCVCGVLLLPCVISQGKQSAYASSAKPTCVCVFVCVCVCLSDKAINQSKTGAD